MKRGDFHLMYLRHRACIECKDRCKELPDFQDLTQKCPQSKWPEKVPEHKGMGDLIEVAAKPIARLFGLECLDDKGQLKPESGCAKRKAWLNKMRFPV